ncbi:MAG TPA: DUF3106 domain-containing protein [Rubrivivax sp.]|nr:DUF3106 domain-containing protein [Rubrivivax sp.]
MSKRARSDSSSCLAAALGAALLSLGLAAGGGARAQPAANPPAGAPAGPAWSSLTPAQQAALQPLQRDWAGIDEPRKQKWLEIAARMPSMSADDRQRVQQRMAEWSRMSPEERGRARLQFQETRQLSPQQRQSRWDAYLALPAEERRALANSAKTVPKVKKSAAEASASAPAPAGQKSRVAATAAAAEPVAPTLVQAKPGASTTLISNTATPPAHTQAGQPKIATGQGLVNRRTLLPQKEPQKEPRKEPQTGPQAAPAEAAASSAR